MLSGDQCNGVSELAEGHSYLRGRCKQLGNLYSPNRDDGQSISCSDYSFLIPKDEFASPVDAIDKQSENICRRVSMTPGDLSNNHVAETPIDDADKSSIKPIDRRLSRDVGIQAFSLDIEEEKEKAKQDECNIEIDEIRNTDRSNSLQIEPQHKCIHNERFILQREHRPSVYLRRDSCHFHKLVSPQNEIIMAHCSGTTPMVMEYTDSFDTTCKSHDGSNFIELSCSDECTKRHCSCYDQYHDSVDSTEPGGHRYSSICSSDSSTTITKFTTENSFDTVRRSNKWRSSSVYFMDPCIEDATENAPDGEYDENEQAKPLLEQRHQPQRDTISTAYEKSNNYRKKNSLESIKQRTTDVSTVGNVDGIELANDAVCPFGLAKNLEKQICIIPSRKKKSSSRPSCLKLITLILIGSAILITSAAIKEALMTKRGN